MEQQDDQATLLSRIGRVVGALIIFAACAMAINITPSGLQTFGVRLPEPLGGIDLIGTTTTAMKMAVICLAFLFSDYLEFKKNWDHGTALVAFLAVGLLGYGIYIFIDASAQDRFSGYIQKEPYLLYNLGRTFLGMIVYYIAMRKMFFPSSPLR